MFCFVLPVKWMGKSFERLPRKCGVACQEKMGWQDFGPMCPSIFFPRPPKKTPWPFHAQNLPFWPIRCIQKQGHLLNGFDYGFLWAWKSSSNIRVEFILNPFLSMQITQKIPSDSIRDPEISSSWRPRPAIERVTKNHPKKVTKTRQVRFQACRVVLGTPQFSLEVAWLPIRVSMEASNYLLVVKVGLFHPI